MRELIPKVCAVVGAGAMYLLIATEGQQAQGAAGLLVSSKGAFQAAFVGAMLGYGVGYLISALLPKPATASGSENFARGVSLLAEGKSETALAEFEKSLSEATGDKKADSLYNIAVCQVRLGNHDAAVAAIRQAIAVDSTMAAEIGTDADFAPLRASASFQKIVALTGSAPTASPIHG